MGLDVCKECGRLYHMVLGSPHCPMCKEKLRGTFQKVQEYITEHVDAELEDVSEACDVEIDRIEDWIRDRIITLPKESNVWIQCKHCGVMIHAGELCKKCKKERVETGRRLYEAFTGYQPLPSEEEEIENENKYGL